MEITVWNRQRLRRVDGAKLSRFVARLAAEIPHGRADRLGVCLVGDRAMREANRRHRAKDGTTDVLSFPAGARPDPEGGRHLVDILISVPQAARQARAAGHALDRELRERKTREDRTKGAISRLRPRWQRAVIAHA